MSERELREKYGGKLDKAINRAIRAEIEGGNAALDRLTALAGPARHSGWYDKSGKPTEPAAAYFKHQRDVVGKMEEIIRRKWSVGPSTGVAAKKRAVRNSAGKPNRRSRPSGKPARRQKRRRPTR